VGAGSREENVLKKKAFLSQAVTFPRQEHAVE
jgi:hypothetical protein